MLLCYPFGMDRKRLYLAMYIALSLVLALCGIEALLRLGVIKYTFKDDRSLTIYLDRALLFRFLPHCREDFNNYGYRDRDFTIKKPQGKRRVLFYGDSFIMGLHVEPDQTIPKALERASGGALEVYNMGVYSYGPDQSLVQFQSEGAAFRPDAVVLNIYPSNDFNDLMENHIFSLDENGALVQNPQNAITARLSNIELLNLANYIGIKYRLFPSRMAQMFWVMFGESNNDETFVREPDSDLAYQKFWLMRTILKEFKLEAQRHNVRLMVSILPSIWNAQEPEFLLKQGWPQEALFLNETLIEEACSFEGVECVNFAEIFKQTAPHAQLLYDSKDHHLSVYGHEVVAETLSSKLK